MIHNLQKVILDIKSNYRPERVADAIAALEYSEDGLNWYVEWEPIISASVASIANQWKTVTHDNSFAKNWGQGVLNLLKLSNQALHWVSEIPGQQLNTWRAVNAGIYKYTISFHCKMYTLFKKNYILVLTILLFMSTMDTRGISE